MDPEEFFHLAEKSIQRIRRVRHMEHGIPLKGEQVWQIVFQTVICGTDLLVRVVKMFSVIGIRPFFQEIFPFRKPFSQQFRECSFIDERECLSDREQFQPRLKFRFQGEIPSQDLFLVEVAHLDGHVRKNLFDAPFSIQDDTQEDESLRFQSFPCIPIHLRILSPYELPEDILFQSRGPEYQYSITAREEGNVCYEDKWSWKDPSLFENDRVELFLDPWFASSMFVCELRQGLLVPDVFAPKMQTSML